MGSSGQCIGGLRYDVQLQINQPQGSILACDAHQFTVGLEYSFNTLWNGDRGGPALRLSHRYDTHKLTANNFITENEHKKLYLTRNIRTVACKIHAN